MLISKIRYYFWQTRLTLNHGCYRDTYKIIHASTSTEFADFSTTRPNADPVETTHENLIFDSIKKLFAIPCHTTLGELYRGRT